MHSLDHLNKEKKSKEPNVEPRRTLQVTFLTLMECPGKLTSCFLFSRNDFYKLLVSPSIPSKSSLTKRISWLTDSNAF